MENSRGKPAVFLDRDGTILELIPYLKDPSQTELVEGAKEGIIKLNQKGILTIVVSNQSGIGRGYYSFKELFLVSQKMEELLHPAKIDGIYYDPSSPDHHSGFRKPEKGMIDSACAFYGIDPAKSWIIGDDYSDLMLSFKTGIPFILVLTGYGKNVRSHLSEMENKFTTAQNLYEAVDIVLNG
ncbi:HAD-IIIA family hydrolase [candidate division WOR-3 bacterium]|nr:HAD-IIIA family hydrolase [candidate division WOR-3 bacterium]